MSEVAVVAAITGGASVLTSGVTAAITWAVSKNSASVELAKMAAENERLQQSNREEERRNRQTTYHDFIDVLQSVFQRLGAPVEEPGMDKPFTQYAHLSSGVMLFGPHSVREGVIAMNKVYNRLWDALEQEEKARPDSPRQECWASATQPLRDEFHECTSKLIAVMHADVTRGIIEDPDI